MSETQDIQRGQTWRRIKDGTLVEIVWLDYDMDGFLVDVIWREVGERRSHRRACDWWAFRQRYEFAHAQRAAADELTRMRAEEGL